MRSPTLPLLAAFAASALAPAQDQPRLREVARTEAIGGRVTALSLRTDGRRLLTGGACGDLILWELPSGRVLHRQAMFDAKIDAVAVHPSRPLALFAMNYGNDLGAVFALDTDTGRTRFVAACTASDLVFSPDGARCAVRNRDPEAQQILTLRCDGLVGEGPLPVVERTRWQVAQPGTLRFVTHPDGARAEVEAPQQGPEGSATPPPAPDFREVTETATHFGAYADDGTFVAADEQGQLLVQGHDPLARRTLTGHRGGAHRLVWTPDGRFLALVSPGAVRVVDTNGRVVADLLGGCHVQAGPQGSEFWLLGRHDLRRWNAAEARDVGREREWSEPRARLVASERQWREGKGTGLAPAMVLDGEPWFCTSRWSKLHHLGESGAEALRGLREPLEIQRMVPLPAADAVVCYCQMPTLDEMASVEGGWSDRLVHIVHGQFAANADSSTVLGLFADAGNGSTVLVFRIDFEKDRKFRLERRRVDDLSIVTTRICQPDLLHVAPLDDHRLLAATATTLTLLDATTLADAGCIELPADLPGITTFAVAPDHLHIAIANGPDVRILRVE